MLFHITHVHTEETCPYGKPEVVKQTFARVLPAFEEAGVKVIGSYMDAPAHTAYYIVETSDVDDVRAGLGPIIPIGTADIRAVTEAAPLVEERARG